MMKLCQTRLRSNLKNARGLGSSKDGVSHWWTQRLTAIALVPIMIWFVILMIRVSNAIHPEQVAVLFASPLNVVIGCVGIVISLYHGFLGIVVVIEDYVHCEKGKTVTIIFCRLLTILTGAAGLYTLITLHFHAI